MGALRYSRIVEFPPPVPRFDLGALQLQICRIPKFLGVSQGAPYPPVSANVPLSPSAPDGQSRLPAAFQHH
jgi:hypothetical protein